MITPEMIPDEVVNAAWVAWLRSDVNAKEDWRAAVAAAFNAWPGGAFNKGYKVTEICGDYIILPLPQKDIDQ